MPALAYVLLNFWVVSAWDIWWYGGSIGQRALVQSYAVLALPWAAAVAWLLLPERRTAWRVAAVVVAVLLVDLNLFQHWQYMRSIIHPEDMTRRYYWAVFNKTMPTPGDYTLLDTKTHLPRAERHYKARLVSKRNFEQVGDTAAGISAEIGFYSRHSYQTDAARSYGEGIVLPLGTMGLQPGQFIRASCRVFSDWGAWNHQLVMALERRGKTVQWYGVRLQNSSSINHAWNHVYFDAPLPNDAQPDDVLKLYPINYQTGGCYVDEIAIEVMEPID